jgi:hypothetical protein
MRLLCVAFGVCLSFAALTQAQSQTVDPSTPTTVNSAQTVAPDAIKSDGAFTYSVPIDIPAFRGLPPKLALSYLSSDLGRGRPEILAGTGWSLTGLPLIERVSEGGGLPTYNDAQDIFQLGGGAPARERLMACADAAATVPRPQSHPYPALYLTAQPSASCSSGGDYERCCM